jgi:hypothetical protein
MRQRVAPLAGAAALALAVACGDIITDPSAVASVQLRRAYPSVVSGDSLRDSSGIVAPLEVLAYNYRNEQLADAPLTFTAIDTLVEIGSTGRIRGRGDPGGRGRVAVSAGGLQVLDTIPVTARPDSVAGGVVVRDTVLTVSSGTIVYYPPTDELQVRVLNVQGALLNPVESWLVSFQVQFHGRLLPPTDTAAAYLVQSQNSTRPSWVDTTSGGSAGRRVRVRADSLAPAGDSVIVFATVRHRGQPIRGSPFRLVVVTRPSGQ